jgi:hypothetical protein
MEIIEPESKVGRGGRRPGAGRKPCTIKGMVKQLPKDSAELILAEIKANQKWLDLANSEDENIQLKVLMYLTDRAYGKAKQSMQATGEGGGPVFFKLLRLGGRKP